jgi:hypothetical protein
MVPGVDWVAARPIGRALSGVFVVEDGRPSADDPGRISSSEAWATDLSRWAAAGSVDTDLSFSSFLECYRTDVAEC